MLPVRRFLPHFWRMRTLPEAVGPAAAVSHVPSLSQAAVPAAFRQKLLNGEDLDEITVNRLQELLKAGRFTSNELTKHCISRIQSVSHVRPGYVVSYLTVL